MKNRKRLDWNDSVEWSNMKTVCLRAVFCLALACLLLSALTACAVRETYENRQKIRGIRVGMTQEQVREIMGKPLLNEVYNTPRVWFYYTRNRWFDGYVTRDECTPLVFDEEGRLEGWGQDYFKTNYTLGDWSQKSIDRSI